MDRLDFNKMIGQFRQQPLTQILIRNVENVKTFETVPDNLSQLPEDVISVLKFEDSVFTLRDTSTEETISVDRNDLYLTVLAL